METLGWLGMTLIDIIEEYHGGDDDPINGQRVPLDGDEVDDLVEILKAKINLHEGNITEEEYNKILG